MRGCGEEGAVVFLCCMDKQYPWPCDSLFVVVAGLDQDQMYAAG